MAKTGSITITQGTQDIANNKTYITVTGKITTSGESYRGDSRTGTISVTQDGTSIYSDSFTHGAPANSTTTLFTVGFWVTHKSNGSSGTIVASYNYDDWCTASTSTTLTSITRTFTNTIGHWAGGFKNSEGNNSGKNLFFLANTTFTKTYGTSMTLTANDATTIPNGFFLNNVFGTSSVTGSWQSYALGTSLTQQAKAMSFEYDYTPYYYNITYDLDGGTNNASNPSTYNVLYGVILNEPTKEYYTFDGWYAETETRTIAFSYDSYYTARKVINDLQPGTTYTVTMDSASLTSGSATQFATLLYDYTDNKCLAETRNAFGNNISYSITCPETADSTHDLTMLIYAGVNGSTWGNKVEYKNVTVSYNLGYRRVLFNANNIHLVKDGGISNGVYSEAYPNYAATPDLIPITGGVILRSNMTICGIYTYDSNKNFIKRESSYSTIHPISSNASYMRVEVAVVDVTLDEYNSNLVIENAIGINTGDNATFSSSSDLYNKLGTRMTGNVTAKAIWIPYKYTITFNGNGGTTTVDSLEVAYETTQNNDVSQYIPQRQAYEFLGWYSSPTGGVQVYDANGLCTNDGIYWLNDVCVHTEDYTLYAQWKALNIAYGRPSGVWVLYYVYKKINGAWYPCIMKKKLNGDYDLEIAILTDENNNYLTDENGNIFVIIK